MSGNVRDNLVIHQTLHNLGICYTVMRIIYKWLITRFEDRCYRISASRMCFLRLRVNRKCSMDTFDVVHQGRCIFSLLLFPVVLSFSSPIIPCKLSSIDCRNTSFSSATTEAITSKRSRYSN